MGSAIDPNEIKRIELTEVYSHPDAKVDIVLVHGLNGNPQKTWTSEKGVFWPTQLLPVALKSSKARILVYGYNADVYTFGSGGPSSDMIHQHAQTLLVNLALERKAEEVEDHPIIWIAHSLGGILVKKALNLSSNLKDKNFDDLRSIAVSTYGIIFLGTPHTGADPAKWGLMLQRMVNVLIPKNVVHTENQLVKTLQSNNETLQNINADFLEIFQKFQICMVHETQKTDLKGTKALIVDNLSASPPLPGVTYFGIEATHSLMCKFDSKNSPGWSSVAGSIKTWVEDSPGLIESRRRKEKEDRYRNTSEQVAELMRPYGQPTTQPSTSGNTPGTSQQMMTAKENQGPYRQPGLVEAPSSRMRFEFEAPEYEDADTEMVGHPGSLNSSRIIVPQHISIEPSDPEPDIPDPALFIKPPGFRPNSLFVGRENELVDMHKMLMDGKRRDEGTSAILIQSLPGGGKTHLARQYIYKHKSSYPGGIFWLRAKSEEELAAGFWDIARKAVFHDLKNAHTSHIDLQNSDEFISLVKDWLDNHHDWLLVLDGIHFNESEKLRKFIPDSRGTSLIYTSTEKAATGDHHLLNPQIIKLPALSAREAQRLFLLELGRQDPFSTDDLKYAMELVQAMGFLPIVIHTTAHRLLLTSEPLSKAARSYASSPHLSGLDTYKAVVSHLERLSPEALNLIKILCFYSQHIPVEMISLGLKGLDLPIKMNDPLNGRNLNNTFRYLNMFALMDRNELETTTVGIESSQSSRGSRDMLGENVDVIRLHGVVQGFFIDTLNADESLPLYLYRAVMVFCDSYDKAADRIASKSHAGLVEDYRLYEIHGKMLEGHCLKHERRWGVLEEAHQFLDVQLGKIKMEIERRTPESSQTIAGGRPEEFQTSIFDRTSSSSDTGPETPQYERHNQSTAPWFENEQHLESPSSLTHDIDYQNSDSKTRPPRTQVLLPPEESGYESELEGSIAMTLQPSQRTVKIEESSPASPSGGWETVRPRRQKKPAENHRTLNWLDQRRYHDRAGSYRAVASKDPRATNPTISHETAKGFLQRTGSRAQSRGRFSGQSSAEVALTNISQTSPPAPRGGGMIRDRSSSQRPEPRRMRTGTSSYAAAVTSSTRDHAPRYQEASTTEAIPISNGSIDGSVCSSAINSLQKFPVEGLHLPASPRGPIAITPMPPYPPTPNKDDAQRWLSSETLDTPMPEAYGSPGDILTPYNQGAPPTRVYPMCTGPVPIESVQTRSRSSTGPNKRSLPHEYTSWHSQNYVESEERVGEMMSLSSPNIRISGGTYVPGRPELSFTSGYTSQPMSRDASGQSSGAQGRRRSVAETEPLPHRPNLSPPTSYQAYQEQNDPELKYLGNVENRGRGRSTGGPVKKSPRLGAKGVRERSLEDWDGSVENLPPQRRVPLNPNTPPASKVSIFSRAHSTVTPYTQPFSPAPSFFRPSPTLPHSAPITTHPSPNAFSSVPANHGPGIWAPPVISRERTSPPHNLTSQFKPPAQAGTPWGIPRSFAALGEPDPMPAGRRGSDGFIGGENMGMTSSGGIRIGDGLIQFGEREMVDTRRARERVERTWVERRESSMKGLGISGVGVGSKGS